MEDPVRAAGGTLGNYALQGGRERPMSEVLKDIVGNLQEIVRSEVHLARAELKAEASRSIRASMLLGAGGAAGLFAAGFLLVCLAQLLSFVMPAWGASLLIAVVLGLLAIVMISKGRERFRIPAPDRTIENVKENVEWIKNQTKS